MKQVTGEGGGVEPRLEVDVVEIMKQVRARAGQERQKLALSRAMAARRDSQTTEDLGLLQSAHDIRQMHFSSHRKVVGEVIARAKRILQQLLTPILERQSTYNAVNARLVTSLCERADRMEDQLTATLEALRAEETAFLETLRMTVMERLEKLGQQQAVALHALREEVAAQNREHRAQGCHDAAAEGSKQALGRVV
jgi:hypothetical protein